MDFFPFVFRRAERTGGIILPVVILELIEQELALVDVQVPSVVRLRVYPLYR